MFKKVHVSDQAPAPIGPYSQAVEVGGLIFCSGQIPLDAKTGQIVLGGVAEQTKKVMTNIEAVLSAADLNFSNIVKTTIFLTSMSDFSTVNEIYANYFTSAPPARSTVEVSGLPKGVSVEIEVIAKRL
ncbi:MAG: RidA family protein [Bdellovibrionales bacterium]|nr:RidA family protein [Bdellovibrionales bacterium]